MCLTFIRCLTIGFIFLLFSPLFANGHSCSEGFFQEVGKLNISNCKKKTLGAELGWNYNDKTRRLDIAFGARLESEKGWLAWGLNPTGPHMVGTRALVGIKLGNSRACYMYNITEATKMGCPIEPVDDLGLGIKNCSFLYSQAIEYYIIEATVVLPPDYNSSRTNFVWQVGYDVSGKAPKNHPNTLKNFDSTETIDLNSNQLMTYTAHHLRRIRTVHGILNIVGWGTFLPVGAIVARYFRKFPNRWNSWNVFHVNCQIAGYILGSSGWGIGLWLGNNSKYYCFRTHRIFGIIIFTFTTIQMLALRLKPHRTDPYRDYWNMYHHFLGYALLALISVNIFKGIEILKTENSSWKWAYIGVLGCLATIAVALEVYTWAKFISEKKSQGKTDQNAGKSEPAPSAP